MVPTAVLWVALLAVAPAIAQPNSAVKTARDSAAKSRAAVAEAQQVEFN